MKLKLNKDGSAVVRNGAPVYVLDNGTEREIDGAAAMKLAIGKHFEASPVMDKLSIPAGMAAAVFGDSFQIQGGKLVALDRSGVQMYSSTRPGERGLGVHPPGRARPDGVAAGPHGSDQSSAAPGDR